VRSGAGRFYSDPLVVSAAVDSQIKRDEMTAKLEADEKKCKTTAVMDVQISAVANIIYFAHVQSGSLIS